MGTQVRRWTTAALLAAAVVIGGCGGGSDDGGGSTAGTDRPPDESSGGSTSSINVVGKEFSYDPTRLTLKAGEGSTIVLKNDGSIEHDITVDEARFKLTVPGNDTSEKVLKVDKPGTYQFYCSVPGHKDAGMKGELTVT
jgi:uncharacterized cupredoxin-like copper-binding protein